MMTHDHEMVKRVASAIDCELYRQDHNKIPDNYEIAEDGIVDYIDQSPVDMFAVARAAIEAMNKG